MNIEISVFIICIEAIIYLLLYNLHDCTFKERTRNDARCNNHDDFANLSFILKVLVFSET